MSTIDEILASGRYVDRRGREWVRRLFLRPNIRWVHIIRDRDGIGWPGEKISEDRMRLLTDRDQHRDECRGLRRCIDHPVPVVISWTGKVSYPQIGAHWKGRAHYASTLPEAMDAAHALAVGE